VEVFTSIPFASSTNSVDAFTGNATAIIEATRHITIAIETIFFILLFSFYLSIVYYYVTVFEFCGTFFYTTYLHISLSMLAKSGRVLEERVRALRQVRLFFGLSI
jgi:hypothetical protein